MSTGQGRLLKVLIASQQNSFEHVLTTNIQCWGYETRVLPSSLLLYSRELNMIEGDILLYDLDELSDLWAIKIGSSGVQKGGLTVHRVSDTTDRQSSASFLIIVLSTYSISRTMMEQFGAVAWLQKPFEMSRLQRYLKVLQRLICAGSQDILAPMQRSYISDEQNQNIRVLVVDDDVDVAYTICQCLVCESGFDVAVAHNGLEALEQCLDWHPRCIVTDLIMPWMNGYQVMRCLAVGPLHMMPAFVVMSALTQREEPTKQSYLRDSAVAYVEKPFHIDHLLTAIKQVCAG